MEHVVIQDPKQTYGDITNLDVLCRCRSTRHPPYGKVNPGDTVYVQCRGAGIEVKYRVSSATSTAYDEIEEIKELCRGTSLYGATQYWLAQQNRRYGTVVWLADPKHVTPPIARKAAKGDANDWIVLDKQEKRCQWPDL